MTEYALILVLIGVVVVLILTTLGKQVKDAFSNVSSVLGS
jgi:Flp pilus assembly pilin Flp